MKITVDDMRFLPEHMIHIRFLLMSPHASKDWHCPPERDHRHLVRNFT